MDFFKKNLWLLLGGSLALLLLLAAGGFLYWQVSTFRRVNVTLAAEQNRLQQLQRRVPYPSETNVVLVQSNLLLLTQYQQQLVTRLRQHQIEPLSMEPVNFNHYLQATIRKMFAQADQLKIKLPPRFAFGFESYYREGLLPANADVPRLTVQVQTVEALFDLLCQNKISEIVALERQTFDARATAGEMSIEAVRPRLRGEAANPAVEVRDLYPLVPPGSKGLYTREHITLTLQIHDETMLTLLNALASSGTPGTNQAKFFAVVSKLDLSTLGSREKDIIKKAIRQPGPRLLIPESTADGANQPTEDQRPHEERIVAGRETVRVQMGLDVYRLNTTLSGKAKP